mmetsp:Transcript_25694/g.79060  ORF Transcript_25694/g.79060 Transcript_25694/m.79060 type:complete len:332 (-) Transcript_25694:33-1028(-)
MRLQRCWLVLAPLATARASSHHHREPQKVQEISADDTTDVLAPQSNSKYHSNSLAAIYENYDEAPLFDHWQEYAAHYERHFPKPCSHRQQRRQQQENGTYLYHALNNVPGSQQLSNADHLVTQNCEPVKMLEIGVQSGGSTRVWKKYYGDQLRYTGVDINPKCKRSESLEENVAIEIGSQLDAKFLLKVCEEHGPFDVVIDDGGHTFDMINATLHYVWPESSNCLKPHAVYAVEDLHAMVMCNFKVNDQPYCDSPKQFQSLLGELFISTLYYWDDSKSAYMHQNPDKKPHPVWGTSIAGIHLYDSLMFLLRSPDQRPMTRINKGWSKIPYN